MIRDPWTGAPLVPPDCFTRELVQCLCCGDYFEPLDMDLIHDAKYGCDREGRCRFCPKEEKTDA